MRWGKKTRGGEKKGNAIGVQRYRGRYARLKDQRIRGGVKVRGGQDLWKSRVAFWSGNCRKTPLPKVAEGVEKKKRTPQKGRLGENLKSKRIGWKTLLRQEGKLNPNRESKKVGD